MGRGNTAADRLRTATCFVLAVALISIDSRPVHALSFTTCVLTIIGYAATRLIAFPMLGDDVGDWGEPLGVLSIAAETAAAALAGRLPRRAPSGEGAVATT